MRNVEYVGICLRFLIEEENQKIVFIGFSTMPSVEVRVLSELLKKYTQVSET